jgi:hypothetical protein
MVAGKPLVADINGDGIRDVMFSPGVFPHVMRHPFVYPITLLGTSTGTLTPALRFSDASGSLGRQAYYRFDIGDINNDGINDIVGATHGAFPEVPGERLGLIYGSPYGLSDQSDRLPHHQGGNDPQYLSRGVSLGDIDGDGDLDMMFTGNSTSGQGGLFLNQSNGTSFTDVSDRLPFSIRMPYGYTSGQSPFLADVELDDLNGDGTADIIAPYYMGSMSGFISINNGSGYFPEASTFQLPPGLYGTNTKYDEVVTADIDGDGFKDIILSQGQQNPYYVGRQLQVIKNYGGKEFKDESWRIAGDQDRAGPKGHAEGHMFVIDFDRDGDLDILDTSGADNWAISNRLFLNDGAGHFSKAPEEMLPKLPVVNGSVTPNLIPIDLGNPYGYDLSVVRVFETTGGLI